MPASLSELYNGLRASSILKQRVEMACLIAARTVRAENESVAHHAERKAWADTVWSDPDKLKIDVEVCLLACLEDATIYGTQGGLENASDNDIMNVVASQVNFLAGVQTEGA